MVELVGENRIDLFILSAQAAFEGELGPQELTFTGSGSLETRGSIIIGLATVDGPDISCQEWTDKGLIPKSGTINATYYRYELYADQVFDITGGTFIVDNRERRNSLSGQAPAIVSNVDFFADGGYDYEMTDENGNAVSLAPSPSGNSYYAMLEDGSYAYYVRITNPHYAANPFTDVPADSFYYYPVLWALENNITNGLSATEFGPTAACNRAQVVTFLYRAYN